MKGVIVDRDGTLIDFVRDVELGVVTPAFHPDQLRLLPGVVRGLRSLQDAGFVLAIATNQPDAAKGRITVAAIERTNAALVELLESSGVSIAAVEACLHHPEGAPGGDAALVGPCDCRKPAPGMLGRIIQRFGLDPMRSWMAGDTAADLGAARAAGLRCALLLPVQRCELCPIRAASPTPQRPDIVAPRFDQLAVAILEESS